MICPPISSTSFSVLASCTSPLPTHYPVLPAPRQPLCPVLPWPGPSPGPQLREEPAAQDPTLPPGGSGDWIRLIGLRAMIPLVVPNEISREPAPRPWRPPAQLAPGNRGEVFLSPFIYLFLAEIISGRSPGSWQGAQLSSKCNCGACGAREAQAAGAWEPLPPGLCTETSGWLGRQCPRWPLAQAQWTPNPIQERGSTLFLEDREGRETWERGESEVCPSSAVEDAGTHIYEEP